MVVPDQDWFHRASSWQMAPSCCVFIGGNGQGSSRRELSSSIYSICEYILTTQSPSFCLLTPSHQWLCFNIRPLEFTNISKLVGGDITQKVCNGGRETDSGQWQRGCHIDTAELDETKGSFQLNTLGS